MNFGVPAASTALWCDLAFLKFGAILVSAESVQVLSFCTGSTWKQEN